MPSQPTIHIRLNSITACCAVAVDALEILAGDFNTPFLEAICNTTQSLLKSIETVKQNKETCIDLIQQTYELLNAIIVVHIKSASVGELPPTVLKHIRMFTETLYKIHAFVEAQKNSSTVKRLFRQGEMNTLLKDCRVGLKQGVEVFQIETANTMTDVRWMQENARKRHQEVLDMIEALSDVTSSDKASSLYRAYSDHKR
ncbi:hypothetical protein B0H19DRAFT_1074343 [Mycena capillaripes]|nr:hypothetical protein B0H19DRAFT_1074343 [Mycena capillaripes]